MLANSLDSSSWLILSKQWKMFPHKQNIAATHSLQVLQGFVQPPLPSLCCHVAPSYFFRGSPGPFLSHPPNSTETSTPQPSTETCAYMCVCVRLFLCVHVHKPLCVHIFVCVCVCVHWYCTYLSHTCLFRISQHKFWSLQSTYFSWKSVTAPVTRPCFCCLCCC